MKCGIHDIMTTQKIAGRYGFHCCSDTAIITSTNSSQSTTVEEEMECAHKVLHPYLQKRKHFCLIFK